MIDETVEEIREMKTHSSSVVAVKAARALTAVLDREYATVEEYVRALERNSEALKGASPSHATLWTTQRDILEAVEAADAETVGAAKDATEAAIERVVDRVETAKDGAARAAASHLTDGTTLLTHDYSTTVLSAIERALEDGKSFEVFVTEARPRHLGRKTARALAPFDGVDVTLIVDSAAGYYLDECDEVVVGMDCIVDDVLYNRVGTYPLAATAADRDVPVTVVGSSAKLATGGFRFQNEHRSPSEVMREPADGFDVANPAYDATPTRLLERVVTDRGVESV